MRQEGSESTSVINPSSLTRMASGRSRIVVNAPSVRSNTPLPISNVNLNNFDPFSFAGSRQEGSESTAVINPGFLTRMASGRSRIVVNDLSFRALTTAMNTFDPFSFGRSRQEGSGSTAVQNPGRFGRLASGFSRIYSYARSGMSHTHSQFYNLLSWIRSRSSQPPVLPVSQPNPNSNTDQLNEIYLANRVAQAFREMELGKAFLTFIMPIATILLTISKTDLNELLFPSILCLISAALVSLFYGNSVRNIYPRIANAFEQFGAACICASFFMAVGTHLPPFLTWVPYSCFTACVLLSVYSCLPF
ncbi:hypothetical protein U1Q18_002495 [Sarracenia purpurea var. burkii]